MYSKIKNFNFNIKKKKTKNNFIPYLFTFSRIRPLFYGNPLNTLRFLTQSGFTTLYLTDFEGFKFLNISPFYFFLKLKDAYNSFSLISYAFVKQRKHDVMAYLNFFFNNLRSPLPFPTFFSTIVESCNHVHIKSYIYHLSPLYTSTSKVEESLETYVGSISIPERIEVNAFVAAFQSTKHYLLGYNIRPPQYYSNLPDGHAFLPDNVSIGDIAGSVSPLYNCVATAYNVYSNHHTTTFFYCILKILLIFLQAL